jgi:hypothetical protein
MLRVLVVMPIYLAAIFLIPHSQALGAVGDYLDRWSVRTVLGASAILGIVGAAGVWYIEHRILPYTYAAGWVWRVLRMFLIGLLVMAILQYFYYFSAKRFDLFAIFLPLAFLVAEAIYEFVEFVLERFTRKSGAAGIRPRGREG